MAIFTKGTFGTVNKVKIRKDVLQAVKSSPQTRAEIKRVFQMANRRIQNIESSGMLSPAVQALNKGDINSYSKFSMRGSWQELKIEYGKAVSFLRQPTSTLRGTREYATHLQKTYDLTADEYKIMQDKLLGTLTSISDTNFVDRYLMRYKDFTGEMEQSASDISTQIESDAESVSRAIDREIEEKATEIEEALNKEEENLRKAILSALRKFGV